ncbi:hypothetical protein PT2222_120069 [Paraburkholderia tropica]
MDVLLFFAEISKQSFSQNASSFLKCASLYMLILYQ